MMPPEHLSLDASGFAWYALWTRSRHEHLVHKQLDQKEVEAFLPTVARWSHWKDRKKRIDWPLFPGYCFARFDRGGRLAVLKCTGVVNIVSCDGEPMPIPDHEIDGVRRLVETELLYDPCPLVRRARWSKSPTVRSPALSAGSCAKDRTRASCSRSI